MFIARKKAGDKEYFYLRETKRVEGKVKSKDVAYLGTSKEEATRKFARYCEGNNLVSQTHSEIRMKEFKNKKENKQVMAEGIKIEKKAEVKKEIKETSLTIDELATFCKRKGFVFKSSEIYGGFSGFWDYGPLGVELLNNVKKAWWNHFVQEKENMIGIDASIISHPRVWKASGHAVNFNDLMIYCKKHKKNFRVDHLINEVLEINVEGKKKEEILEIIAGNRKKLEQAGYDLENEIIASSLMFKTNVSNDEEAYLRPETAQGMFSDFRLAQETSRKQLPFGIAQIGKCFRNEIAPRDFLFRSREFNLAEFEFFIHPQETKCELLDDEHLSVKLKLLDAETQVSGKSDIKETTIKKMLQEKRLEEWHAYWLAEQIIWYRKIGLEKIKIREHMKDELSHYSSATFDIDYEYPFGSKELGGNANRGQFDLTQHMKESGEKLEMFDEKTKSKVIPRVIEPTFGVDRVLLAVLCNSYSYDSVRENIVLKIPANLAPIKAAIFPLVNDEKMIKTAREAFKELGKEWNVQYDSGGSVGRRYARQDEAGTPYCITVDGESLEDNTVTVRWRDNAEQVRIPIKDLKEVFRKVINDGEDLFKLGKKVNTRVK